MFAGYLGKNANRYGDLSLTIPPIWHFIASAIFFEELNTKQNFYHGHWMMIMMLFKGPF